MWIVLIIIIALGWFIWGYIFAKLYFLTDIRRHRSDAISKSKSIHKWFNNEKLAPILPGFPYRPREMTFIGKWIDYIVFNGLSQWSLEEIVFLEIKTGSSNQNTNEKMIEDIIKQGKVRYEILRK